MDHFLHLFVVVALSGKNRITQILVLFVLGKREIEFIGFQLTKDGFAPVASTIQAICNFPHPKNITRVRAWNQTN